MTNRHQAIPESDTGTPASAGVPLLEVIALTAADAVAAWQGGADRLEIVSRIDIGGLTPELEQFQSIRVATELPLRVMLRTNGGFQITNAEFEGLLIASEELRLAGADQFVAGFVDQAGGLDLGALARLSDALAPCPWTLHHAFDQTADARVAWRQACQLSGLDCILTGGVGGDVRRGLPVLQERASWQLDGPAWLAGGGLMVDHIVPLMDAGIRSFHVGRGARRGGSWSAPVSADVVRQWRNALDRLSLP